MISSAYVHGVLVSYCGFIDFISLQVSREKMATSSGRKTLSSVSDTVVVETTEQSMINNQRHSNDRIESRPGCYIARRLSTIRVSRTISSCIVNGNANTSMGTSSSNSSCKSSSRSSDVAGIRRKRKNLQSSNLSIMEKRPSRTVKPRDNYDNFRNLLVQTLDKKSENCCSKIQLELWDRLQQHMKNRSVTYIKKQIMLQNIEKVFINLVFH